MGHGGVVTSSRWGGAGQTRSARKVVGCFTALSSSLVETEEDEWVMVVEVVHCVGVESSGCGRR